MALKVVKNEHIRHNLLFEFNRGSSATHAAAIINTIDRQEHIDKRTAKIVFQL